MSFPNVPKDPGQIPFSSIYVPGIGFIALAGVTPTTDGSGNQSAPVSAALYGKVTNPGDTPLLLDSAGRAIVTVNSLPAISGTVTVSNSNANGQTTSSASAPVVIASDQTSVAVKGSATGAAVPAQAFYLGLRDFAGNLDGIQSGGAIGNSGAGTDSLLPMGVYGYVGSAAADMLRIPNTQKTATATASGNTAVWTPTSGKKFRLMRYKIEVTQNAAASVAAVLTIQFQDATTNINLAHSVFIPSAAATTFGPGWSSEWIDLGNGVVSAAANNVLNVNLSAALTAGNVRVIAIGTEE